MVAISIAILIVAIGTVLEKWLFNSWRKNLVYDYEEKLAEKDKIIDSLYEIEAECILKNIPIVGNFEDPEMDEESINLMLDEYLLTQKSKQN